MNIKRLFFPVLLLCFLNSPVYAGKDGWTEERLGILVQKAEKAAKQKKWKRAIRYGEKALLGSAALDQKYSPEHLNLMAKTNEYYGKVGKLDQVIPRVINTYILSKKHLGLSHETTVASRHLYYKVLINKKNYHEAIALILEDLSILNGEDNKDPKTLYYLKQLYTLYGLTEQWKNEEEALLKYIKRYELLFDINDKGGKKSILLLAQNYCRQKSILKFQALVNAHNLKLYCP